MPKPVVCPVWPSFDANPKVERGLNRPCPVGQSCHTLFPHRNPTNLRLWSEACRLESERCTGSIDCILHSSVQHRQQQALMMLWHRGHRVGPPVTRGATGWQLRAGYCSGRWQLACSKLAAYSPPTANRTTTSCESRHTG